MTFTSLTFLIFLIVVVSLYWILPGKRSRNVLLLTTSYLFYGWWDWRFCFLILASSLFDYLVALNLDRQSDIRLRRLLLAASIAANLGMLGLFKYLHFFVDSFRDAAATIGWDVGPATLQIVLPVGISFYTFQTLGYTIDVSRRSIRASANLIEYLTFVSFFPQLVAGPIERATNLLPQFASDRKFDPVMAASGCRLILWGVAKKLIIADRLGVIVNECYGAPEHHAGPMLALATLLFAFQIYCDFSAYSDIAIGTARLLGIRLMRNFAYPYFSQSVSEFWRRWHISLSTWFRDYVYIPLGGSKGGNLRRHVNLVVTFLISGLWHGAAWNFVAWGGVNGVAVLRSKREPHSESMVPGGLGVFPSPPTLMKIWSTLTIICVAWVFFRAESLADAFLILNTVVMDIVSPDAYGELLIRLAGDDFLVSALAWLFAFVCWEWFARFKECPLEMPSLPRAIRWATYSVLAWLTLLAIPDQGTGEFIYFAF